ncbi:hypothetical protein NL108_015505 [Boleophthalmus pectinirostris]|uniref:uncharacterized protein si:dkeyp-68b7.12 n=1 Tax=Boleophthalmus pectinirostris TaxID=150288 RepID=UPI00242F259F|nr:uncharacterized protein si:dkeyp-68b7.12 [Boleophthalmus pectinirostris]KAJ0059328.1 hypothetical protein NL108_015505 [Boleophthalmus pectinirostris]
MRRVRRKGANKEKVFGCDLMEHLTATNQEIPVVLRSCSEFVESHGIVDGIYRLSGVSSNIQKLRSEFESESSPDMNKDTYLQDIHCVSSLCKAYFRELPNPLLTYQLYDKFAEAVALQLEEARLVKIRDVLKELPPPHYRTLEFLMRHLVRVASFASETNMHSRNLAIVWAPNLLRSKEIEVSGFNGTAAFMEVRVQSIVVEFILTHVPQLFPEPGVSTERRKSLPSPSLLVNQDELFFKSQPTVNIGNLSPGDGPLPIRPYHSIIEGTDKRKGSLKGRKWMSIFNIGGRITETRRKHKHSTKEKEHPTLRSARSMDSLSSPSNNDPKRSPRPPSTHLSIPQPQPMAQPDPAPSSSPQGGSMYAVTYRRGTGLVSTGTQGTYTALDPEGLTPPSEAVQTRSPGLSTKAGRRIAMHITGPTMVTVPLHITSNLAFGVLQGGGADRVIHRGRDREQGDVKSERKGSEVEKKEEEDEEVDGKTGLENSEDGGEKEEREKKERGGKDGEEMERRQRQWEEEPTITKRTKSEASNSEEQEKDENQDDEYMDMKGGTKGHHHHHHDEPKPDAAEASAFDPEEVLNSTEVDDLTLSGYVQDNFEFLDQMDCSIMDCSVSNQINEFSVEPPGHYDEEYETMDQSHHSPMPLSPSLLATVSPTSPVAPPTHMSPPRHLTTDLYHRHTKSLSLPYITSPGPCPDGCSSEDDDMSDDQEYVSSSDEEDDDDENMFVKSLPSDFFLNNLTNTEIQLEEDGKLDGAILEDTEQNVMVGEASQSIQDQILVKREDENTFGKNEESDLFLNNLTNTEIQLKEDQKLDGASLEDIEQNVLVGETSRSIQDEILVQEDDGNMFVKSLPCDFFLNDLTNTEIQGQNLADANLEDTQQKVSEASKSLQDEILVKEIDENILSSNIFLDNLPNTEMQLEDDQKDEIFVEEEIKNQTHESTDEDLHDIGSETVVIHKDELESTEKHAEFEERNQDRQSSKNTKDKTGNVIQEALYQTHEPANEDLQAESESVVMQEDTMDGSDKLEDLEMQCKQEVVANEEKTQEQDHFQEIDARVTSIEPADSSTEEPTPVDEGIDQVDHVLYQQMERADEKHITFYNPLFQEEEEITGGHFEPAKQEVCQDTEQIVPPELDGGDSVVNMLQEQSDDEDIFDNEIGKQETIEKLDNILVIMEEMISGRSEVIEDIETQAKDIEKATDNGETKGVLDSGVNSAENETIVMRKDKSEANIKLEDGHFEAQSHQDIVEKTGETPQNVSQTEKPLDKELHSVQSVGSKVVTSKLPKVYQVKAVPIVPPKPQHCKLTALKLRQQQQQRERAREERLSHGAEVEEHLNMASRAGAERWREGEENARHSPQSMCFDEAVAIATLRRGRGRDGERDRPKE